MNDEKFECKPYVIVRADRAGVFAGYLKSKNGSEIEMEQVRRLWYWDGAASISQIAMEGVSKPENCKFPVPVRSQIILGVIEILNTTPLAQKNIEEVPVWRK